ncbi:hypothetical protein ACWEPI_08370 [Streptomyces sp. NPDC004262]
MTREERLAILGPEVIAKIRARVKEAPEPSDEVVEKLRRIMAHPGRRDQPPSPPEQPKPRKTGPCCEHLRNSGRIAPDEPPTPGER